MKYFHFSERVSSQCLCIVEETSKIAVIKILFLWEYRLVSYNQDLV